VLLYVRYQDNSYDVVDAHTLDKLLSGKSLRQFYRRSEERWINVYRDPIRGLGGDYSGPNRRQPQCDHVRADGNGVIPGASGAHSSENIFEGSPEGTGGLHLDRSESCRKL